MARAWSGKYNTLFQNDLIKSTLNSTGTTKKTKNKLKNINILALSGGGADGAFGAGVLNGWTQTGLRPEFKIVTGISTGALIAPFAFLGHKYDATLKNAYTSINEKNIYRKRFFLWKDSLVDTAPLAGLIRKLINKELIKKIADQHRHGRRLYIGTTNLDADQLVIWNMGAIANSSHPDAVKLFRQIVLASTSVPGAFPPVMIKVKVNGKQYDEMHVDGGVKAQLFLIGANNILKIRDQLRVKLKKSFKIKIYVIRNSKVIPEPELVNRNLGTISTRSLASLIRSLGNKDLENAYNFAQKHNFNFNWIAVPAEFKSGSMIGFDQQEMNKLFNIGYKTGSNPLGWQKTPPGSS